MNLRNILGFALGPIASAFAGLVIVPVMAWNFSPADIGRLNIFQITLSFVLLLSVLGLDQAYVREYSEAKEKGQLLRACFLPGFLLLLVFGAVTSSFSSELANWLYAESDSRLFIVTLFAFFANYISRFLSLILRMQERAWAYSMSQVLPKIVQLALIAYIAPLAVRKDFLQLQIIVFASLVLVLFIYLWNTRKQCAEAVRSRIDHQQLKGLFAFGAPLIFASAAYWALTATSVIMLRSLSSLEELAEFSMANNFAGAAIVFQSIFSVIWAPTIYKWVAQGSDMKIVDRIAQQALAIVCVIVAICGSLSWACDLLLPQRYTEVKYILLCMLMQPLLYTLSEVTCIGIGISRRTVFSIWITLGALLVSVSLNYFLIPRLGAAGAAIANAVAFTVFFIGRTEVSARIWRSFPRKKLYLCVAGLLALAVAMVAGAVFTPAFIHGICIVVLILVICGFKTQFAEMIELLRARRS